MENVLTVDSRTETGKGPNRRLRQTGMIPAVMYGHGNNTKVTVDPRIIEKTLLAEGGRNKIFNITGSGLDGKKAIIKEYQVDPVSRRLLHIDLVEVVATEKLHTTIKLHFIGKAAGAVEGGILNLVEREIEVECFPDKIPEFINVDVSALNIGDSIHLNDLTLPEGVEKFGAHNPTLCALVPPNKEEDATASLEESKEPEVIREKKKDDAPGDDKK